MARAYQIKFLHPLPRAYFAHINIALRVHRQKMCVGQLTGLAAYARETREKFSGGVLKNVDPLIVLINHVHVFLP